MAQQRLNTQIDTMFKLANFRQQAINNAREAYQWIGAENLYSSVKGDPVRLAQVESVLGVPSGSLSYAAQSAATTRNLQERLLRAQVTKAENDAAGTGTTASGQSAADQLTFLRDTIAKAKGLTQGAGENMAEKFLGDLFIGDTNRNRLITQVRTLQSNMLTLATDPNIKKFFGPQMSNEDVKQMLSSATTLDVDSMSKTDLEDELTRLDNIFSKIQRTTPGAILYDPKGGSWVVQ